MNIRGVDTNHLVLLMVEALLGIDAIQEVYTTTTVCAHNAGQAQNPSGSEGLLKNSARSIPQLAAYLPEENRYDFYSTILDCRATQSVGRRYACGVTHLDDALRLWLRTLYLGKRGHPLESQG